jgi:hypothetical protein
VTKDYIAKRIAEGKSRRDATCSSATSPATSTDYCENQQPRVA